ncbi:hypothetical protein CAPTEDRAFT_205965 [Capitella teleta]|uniref:Uncharacterized protein n=1 Tax=Capitella teleta TaxID=283909 RepID=R7TIP0_CAPTE|nr:hypothetical protein CAPTEDRAFT_205965 [Capitella teleta]|eukprot:ELT91406.1 hypothetical protein CAPTEDRAFT_205965 [Capitella teleta]
MDTATSNNISTEPTDSTIVENEDEGLSSEGTDDNQTHTELTDENLYDTPSQDALKEGRFVLVRYEISKTSTKHFAGILTKDITDKGSLHVKFINVKVGKGTLSFVFPEKEDCDEVDLGDIVALLPDLTPSGGISRAAKRYRTHYYRMVSMAPDLHLRLNHFIVNGAFY